MSRKPLLLSIAVIALLTCGISSVANAQGIGLTIQPVKISQTMNPGDTVTGLIHLSNASTDDVNVSATVQDFVPVAGAEGIEFVSRAPGVTSVRDWITIGGKDSFTFKKGEVRDIPYTITAPRDAEPG